MTKSIFPFIKEATQTMHNVFSSSNKPLTKSADVLCRRMLDNAASFSARNIVGAAPKDAIRLRRIEANVL